MAWLPTVATISAFEAVARHLSFTRAAQELHLTQAAVSYRIKTLEAQLGIRLFRRESHGVMLTEAGRSYLMTVRDALMHLEEGTALMIARQKREAGALRILTMQAFAGLWLVPRLREFRKQHPEIDVQVVSWVGGVSRLEAIDFDRHGIDVAILLRSSGSAAPVDLLSEPLVMDFALPVTNPEILRTKALADLSDLRRHVLLHAITWPEIWPLWLSAAGVPDLKPAGEMRLQNTGFTIQAAMNGLGIAMAHAPLISEELKTGTLTAPFRLMLPLDRGYYILSLRDQSESPHVLRFRNWIRSQMMMPSEIAGGAGI
jgi:LysR family glycine cleavage system transcriptional activator